MASLPFFVRNGYHIIQGCNERSQAFVEYPGIIGREGANID